MLHLLVGSGFGIGIAGNAKRADKQRRLADAAIGVMNRNRCAGPIDEQLLARLMLLAQHHILLFPPAPVELAEAAVAVAVQVLLAILLPQQLLGEIAVLPQLLADVNEVWLGPLRRLLGSLIRGKQRRFQAVLIPLFRQRPL